MTTRRRFVLQSTVACIAGASVGMTANAAAKEARSPLFHIPSGACDCHVHVIGPQSRYPMLSDRAYTPSEASVANLRAHLAQIGMSRVVLIQPSFYGTDNACLIDALQALGGMARGIAVIDSSTPDETLQALAANGVKGVRVNLESIGVHDPAAARNALNALARRIAPLGWHIQIYAASNVIAASAEVIGALDVPVVFDHFGMVQTSKGMAQPDLQPIVELVRGGRAYVKLSAPYRISKDGPGYDDVRPLVRRFVEANPSRIVWASDWPHTDRAPGKRPTEVSPFRQVDDRGVLNQLSHWVSEPELRRRILVSNPAALYGF
ncbi:amidohydrolase family protein [Burkholderia plantarii]|uniref:amidohydrolase family protein n=1 Tax=Burkholderia plantarii TaxID=41899 RepID=UPI00272BBB6F|nr:amidohydrolase family protein [Burkholderia plantarii]WLE59533.1 amidohydrolase family protein [Burkholderia plantarii]